MAISSEGSSACQTYYDTELPFIMVIFEARNTHTYCRAYSSGAVITCFDNLGLFRLGFEYLELANQKL